jgi:acyl dehydratase
LSRPFPVEGEAVARTVITDVWDKGRAALVVTRTIATDARSGEELFATRSALFIRDAGGFGGERGPERRPGPELSDVVTRSCPTSVNQALLYRLSGDRNPLHSDPSFARRAGFERPILHGLCTYGITGRALLDEFAKGDASRFLSMHARFTTPVMPGDTLRVDMCRGDDSQVHFQTTRDDGTVVLSDGIATIADL